MSPAGLEIGHIPANKSRAEHRLPSKQQSWEGDEKEKERGQCGCITHVTDKTLPLEIYTQPHCAETTGTAEYEVSYYSKPPRGPPGWPLNVKVGGPPYGGGN